MRTLRRVRAAHTSWASGELPAARRPPARTAHGPRPCTRQRDALSPTAHGPSGPDRRTRPSRERRHGRPERRFARAFERLALPGLHRDARFDLLVTLGELGLHDMQAGIASLRRSRRDDGRRQARLRHRRHVAARAPRERVRSGRARCRSRRSTSRCGTGTGRRAPALPASATARRSVPSASSPTPTHTPAWPPRSGSSSLRALAHLTNPLDSGESRQYIC